ncbi:MAG TPA: hypothetical protein VJB63_03890 [Patescibacteria group bacterium]|nr:hypothetical protein [Patescibacteria group bacterium]
MEEINMDYCKLAEYLYKLIDNELKKVESKEVDLAEIYPKLVVCCEFFRYIRGEFFQLSRPHGLECQKRMYQLEDQLSARISKLRKQLDIRDQRTSYFLNLGKKLFD